MAISNKTCSSSAKGCNSCDAAIEAVTVRTSHVNALRVCYLDK